MYAQSGPRGAPVRQGLLKDATLAGEWALDPRRSSSGLTSKVVGLVRVSGPFREFTAEGVRPSVKGAIIFGTLTVLGRTRPLYVDAALSVRGDGEICLDANVPLNRADFGVTRNLLGLASVHSTLAIHAIFTGR